MSELALFVRDLNPLRSQPERRRFQIYLGLWSTACALNWAIGLTHLFRHGLDGWGWFYLVVLAFSPFSVVPRATRLRKPKRWPLDSARLAALSDGQLDVLEGLLESIAQEEAVEGPGVRIARPPHDEDVRVLIRAGALVDCRSFRGQSSPLYVRPAPGAREALEDERERRLRPSPLGNRSRSSALSG